MRTLNVTHPNVLVKVKLLEELAGMYIRHRNCGREKKLKLRSEKKCTDV